MDTRSTTAVLVVVLLAVLSFAPAGWCAQWEEDLDVLLAAEDSSAQEDLLARITTANPAWPDVAAHIQALSFPSTDVGTTILRETVCSDGVTRPWVVYVPSTYSLDRPDPLLVALHGGVSRAEIIEDPLLHVSESEYTALARANGMLAIFPYGQDGATWWDEVGMGNIRNLVRTMKREYNVDDDRVYMIGFSDGASAGFLHAMLVPTDYAAIVALNGHMGVGSLDGDLPTFAPNFANIPVYAVTTFDDGLYPSERMRPTVEMARKAGGDIFYREYEGEHDFTYAEEELPRIAAFLARHPRDPFPSRITWEAAQSKFGQCRWFKIDKIAIAEPAPWHRDHNAALVSDRIIIGFSPAEDESITGMLVGTIHEDTFAEDVGLAEGDVLEVLRDGQPVLLEGNLPEVENYFIFKREQPSALAQVSFAANQIDVKGSRLGGFTVLVHPDMIRLERNLVVTYNGEVVFDEVVVPNLEYMLRNFLEERDRSLLYVVAIEIEL
jgi:poly(3-hydroxybutyrate) depolymerase